jgi:hypothetical protein
LKYDLDTICLAVHPFGMSWEVLFHPEFQPEYDGLAQEAKLELLARLQLLRNEGPQLGRPTVDTLNGSSFPNMKELRFSQGGGTWRFAFAFDPERSAIMLCGGDKENEDQKSFYKELIDKADARFAAHIAGLKKRSGK